MRILLLHNAVGPLAGPEERDVLDQAEVVIEALLDLGHAPEVVPCDLDLASLRDRLLLDPPDLVFNLVESLGGHDRLLFIVPALLDTLGVPYTGSPTGAILATTHKLEAKARMVGAGLPTPAWGAVWPPAAGGTVPEPAGRTPERTWILKSVWEHGSRGLGDDCVVRTGRVGVLTERLAKLSPRLGGECFAEAFVEGRELNLSILAGPEGPEVLPAAEMDFVEYPADRPRILGHDAKWSTDAFEYGHTVRRFDFAAADQALVDRLGRLARQAWELFGLRGWARVDFRVDEAGEPWILEVNANPCLSPDAGFAAALERAGIPFQTAVERIVADTSAVTGRHPERSAPLSARPWQEI